MKHERYSPNYFFESYLARTKYKECKDLKINKWEDIEIIGKKNIFYIFQILQEIIKFLAENVNDRSADIWCLLSDNVTCFLDQEDSELEKMNILFLTTDLLLKKLQTRITWIEDLKALSITTRDLKEKIKGMEAEDKPILPVFREKNYVHPGKPVLVYLPYFQERKKGEPVWTAKKDGLIWQIKSMDENGNLEIEGKKIPLKSPAIMEINEFKFLQQEIKKDTNFVLIWVYNGQSQDLIETEELLGAIWKARDLNLNAELHRQAAISQGEMPPIQ
jgi:hypothetical protein